MIKPDLKVGDLFTDGDRTYKVLEVVGNGVYISKVVAGGDEPTEEEPKSEAKRTRKKVTE